MIEITPAILTNDLYDFEKTIQKFLPIGLIDIDIIEESFGGNVTLPISTILENTILRRYEDIGFHLIVEYPKDDIETLLNSDLFQKKCRIYIHQESNFEIENDLKFPENWDLCICLKIESELKDLSYYEQFDEVQFMAVEIGVQGNEFQKEVLNKVDRLRSMGYNRKVSIDGGVNLNTAHYIREHEVNRLSVGSYLVRAENLEEAYKALDRELNGLK